MNILTNSHVFSNLVLAVTAIYVFLKYFKSLGKESRILWGVFFMSISVNAIVEMLVFAGVVALQELQIITQAAAMTLGIICLVVASFSLILKYTPSIMVLTSTIAIGLTLLFGIVFYKVPYLGLIIQPFCIIVTLCIACLGLAYRRKSALWIVFSMTLLAVSAKAQAIPLPMHPLDLNHYIEVLTIICIGYAVRDQYKILF